MAQTRPLHPRSLRSLPWLAVAAASILSFVMSQLPAMAADAQTNRIKIEYFSPKDPAHNPTKALLQEHRTLEKLQELLSPFRLPTNLTLRTGDCEGVANAWYDHESAAISVCYEYVEEILRGLPQETLPNGVTRVDAAFGQFVYIIVHEMGHAAFDLFGVATFGNPEDVADQFSTYIMLHFGKEQARRLIGGAAYSYHQYVQNQQVTAPLAAFSDVHGAPAQRFYNLLCLAYGADPVLFADVVDKLPKSRAAGCKAEYNQVANAFRDLITPHIDQELAKRVMDKTWLPDVKPRSSMN
jgi:Putative metallopeptidase